MCIWTLDLDLFALLILKWVNANLLSRSETAAFMATDLSWAPAESYTKRGSKWQVDKEHTGPGDYGEEGQAQRTREEVTTRRQKEVEYAKHLHLGKTWEREGTGQKSPQPSFCCWYNPASRHRVDSRFRKILVERMLKERKQFVRQHFLLHAAAGEGLLELRVLPFNFPSETLEINWHFSGVIFISSSTIRSQHYWCEQQGCDSSHWTLAISSAAS